MIYVEPRAGLCNRMRVMASAYNLAKEYNTTMTVLWRVSEGLNCSYYDLFCHDPLVSVIETKHKFSIKFLVKALKARRCFFNIKEEDGEKVESLVRNKKNVYVNTVFDFYDVKHYEMFVPIPEIEKRIADICQSYASYTIGIHIRRTDNIMAIEHSPLSVFLEFIDKEIEKNSDVRFYLATDSQEVEKEIVSCYKEYIILNENRTLGRNLQKGIEDALIDLGCLSRCDLIAGSYYSSFSETAAHWGKEKELKVLVS